MLYTKVFAPALLLCSITIALNSCVWPKRRYVTVQKDQTVKEFYEAKGIPLSVIEDEARLELSKVIQAGQKVFVPYEKSKEAKTKLAQKESPTAGAGGGDTKLIWPIQGATLSSTFGYRWHRFHEGLDLVAPVGTPIHAAEAGEVIYSGNQISGYGYMIVIKHVGNLASVYAHNKDNLVKKGQKVQKGQQIAQLGNSGKSSGPHLHFELRQGSKPIDPQLLLPAHKKSWADNVIGSRQE